MPSNSGHRWSHPAPGEEVVISGIAGRFPDSNNVLEFRDNLMNKVDLVSDDERRWKVKHPEVPQRTGKINNVNKFDANFFGIHSKNVHTTDPLCRMVLEHTYEAIADAGVNPKDLRGTKTGVFMGASFSESEKTLFYEKMHKEGFGIIGCSRSMYANRISYFLGVHGPSYTVDSACSSSLTCLENAYKAIRDGLCDAAVIGGTQLCLFPSVSLNFARLGVLSPEGKSNCFDESANGYARAEAISAIFLQKAKDAKRIYATVRHSKLNHDGYKERPIEHPSGKMQQQLLEDFYVECDIDPSCIPYVECHSNGLRISDPEELNAVDKVFCKNRNTPLLIGSVKSNMGHTDPASGLCSLVKVLLCFETGYILPNLHYEVPRDEIEGLQEGRMEVVTEPTKWDGGLVGLNNFGFGGSNAHVLLQGNSKKKVDKGVPKDGIPRLVCISGRTEQSVNTILEYLESTELDAEFIRLLQDVNSTEVSGFIYRGYSVLQPGPQRISRDTQYYSGEKKPVWFVFSGMGSQWPGMGTALMKIPVFAAAIERCHQALAPKGVDITKIITDTDSTMFDNILHSFVGIAAIQIGLVDVLTEIGIKPDYIIGHSVGELGCAYADGCFTAEQMILAAYSRGLASIETDVIRGLMAAVGLGYEEVKDMCPPDIEVACHNSASSCTLSGPTESMKKFVAELQEKGIFAREVNCSNIAYHSRYIADAGPRLLKYLKEVIPDPKPRSEKWVSSSVPETEWDSEVAKYSSAEYHTNNLLKPVLFEETARRIPKNAIAIEIAPHGLLQAILRRSLHKDTVNVALTQRGHKDNTQVLLTAIGKLYQQGLTPQISKLYPDIKFPVSRGTQMISPLLRWEHSVDWFMTTHKGKDNTVEGDRNIDINMNDEDNEYLKSNIVGGFNLYPVGSLLVSVWETLAILQGVSYKSLPVIFDNIRVSRSIQLPQDKSISFTIMVQKGTGNFEVHQNGSIIINGRISVPDKIDKELLDLEPPEIEPIENSIQLTNNDVYKELRVRGYDYSGVFKSIVECDISATHGRIQWRDNWAAYIENMIQFRYLHEEKRSIFAPSSIKKIIIDPKKHFYQEEDEEEIQDDQEIENNSQQTITTEEKVVSENNTEIDDTAPVYFYKKSGIIKSAGIEIRGLKLIESFTRKSVGEQVLEKLEFIPYFSINDFKVQDAVSICIQIGLENTSYTNIRIIEVDNCITNPLAEIVASTIKHYPHIQGIVTVLSSRPLKLTHGIKVENKSLINESNNVFLIGTDFVNNPDVLKTAHKVLKKDGFIISREKKSVKVNKLDGFYNVISELSMVGDEKLVVLQKVKGFKPSPNVIINVTDKIGSDPFGYVEQIKQAIKLNKSVLLVSQHEPYSGVYGLVNSLRKDYQFDADQIRCMFILDPTAPIFNVKEALYKEQLDLGLIINIYKDGVWGSFRNIEIENEIRVGVKHAYVDVTKNGDLTSLRWIEGPLNHYLPSEVSVDIYYSALNFRDVMVANGYLSREIVADDRLQECILGLEFVGRESRSGRRVMGLVRGGALSTRIEATERDFVWPVPSNWTFEDAATVPLAYITAYRTLIQIGDMKAGQKVLIHAGAGGVGQAALHLALYYGCEVFTTVGSPEKRSFIKKYFPQIQDDHICNSRDTSFEQQILKITGGKGVDLILNSLSDDKLKATAACIAVGGKFLEIGKLNMDKNNTVGMEMFLKETQLHGVTVDNIFTAYDEEKRELHKLIENGIQVGAVRPLMRTVFNDNEIESAFKFMGVGKHIGKVLVNIRPEENQRTIVPKERYVAAIPKFFCDTSKSYVIIGGFEGFEIELVDWLVFRQARKIVLATKQGIKNGYQAMRMRTWKKLGAEIKVLPTDVTSRDGVAALLHAASLMGPVDAIFHPIVAQHQVLFDQQTPERFVKAYREIAVTVKQLDEVSRKMCPHLRYFVSFSSETKSGQSDHSTACSIVERICEKRKNENLSGVAIRWSAIDDLTEEKKFEKGEEQKRHCELTQNAASCLETLNKVLKQNAPIVVSKAVRRKLIGVDRDVVDAVADIMGIHDLHKIDMNETFSSMQIDWMKTITIRNTLEKDFEIFLTAKDVSSLTFAKLQEISEEQADAVIEYESSGRGEIASLSMTVHIVGDEELSAEPIVRLRSLAVPGDCSPIIFLIPGIDGVHNGFSSFAEKLSGQIVCLQLGYNSLAASVEQMADSILPILKSQLVPKQQFGILGYSFGSLIALELAYRLEAEGKSSFNVCLIDGAPLLFRELIEQYVQTDNMDRLEVAAIISVADIVAPQYSSELEVRLRQIRGWTAKVSAFIETVPEGDYSKHHLKSVCETIYKRFIAAYNYRPDPSKKLQSVVNLIRPKIHLIPNLSEDYDMSEYTTQPVSVSFIRGNHATILEQKKCTEVVNTTMDDRIAFKQLMMCEILPQKDQCVAEVFYN